LGNYGQAILQANKALALIESTGKTILLADILLLLGEIYQYLGDYLLAQEYSLKGLRISQEVKYRQGEARAQILIGQIYNKTGDYHQELDAYVRALQSFLELQHTGDVAATFNRIAAANCSIGEFDNALENAQQSLMLANQTGMNRLEAGVQRTIGDIYMEMGDYPQAMIHFQQSMEIAQRAGFRSAELSALLSMGKLHIQLRKTEDGLQFVFQALAIAEEIETKAEIIECQQVLAEAYKQQGDYEKAYYHYEKFHATKEDLFGEQANRMLMNLQVMHETEAAKNEAEIYRLRNIELEQEISRRMQAESTLQEYADQLESRNAELDAFAQTVAHDLKNSLSALILYSDMPESMFLSLPREIQNSVLHRIAQTGDKLKNIVDELLLLTSVRKQDVQVSPVDMEVVVTDARRRLDYMIEKCQAEVIQPSSWPEVMGHGPWLEEVWVNYISNALKYGGNPPLVELGASHTDHGWVRFWVRDNGQGLSPEDYDRVFTPFERLHQVDIEGYGLGLSIVRRIIEKLGGRVGVESPNSIQFGGKGGTIFYFELPTPQVLEKDEPDHFLL
jgi:signal transduction histidine kinase